MGYGAEWLPEMPKWSKNLNSYWVGGVKFPPSMQFLVYQRERCLHKEVLSTMRVFREASTLSLSFIPIRRQYCCIL